jgi:hypothetical protein
VTSGPADGPIARVLAADHARLGALLDRATARDGVIDPEPYDEFRRALLRHIAIEEKLLLPAAQQARDGAPVALAPRLRLDHGAIAALLVPTPTPTIVATLRHILAGHDAVEEDADGVYAECDRLLGDAAAALADEMVAYPAVRVNPHNDGPLVDAAVQRALARAGYRLASLDR